MHYEIETTQAKAERRLNYKVKLRFWKDIQLGYSKNKQKLVDLRPGKFSPKISQANYPIPLFRALLAGT